MLSTLNFRGGDRWGRLLLVAAFSICTGFFLPAAGFGDSQETGSQNRLDSIRVEGDDAATKIKIRAEKPIGYRYTVYDSLNPTRVVLDFPGFELADSVLPENIFPAPVEKVRTSTLDTPSGKLARVELLLKASRNYEVSVDDRLLTIAFGSPVENGERIGDRRAMAAASEKPVAAVKKGPASEMAASASPAGRVTSVRLEDRKVVLDLDGRVGRYKDFELGAPPRLVLDLYGVKPDFSERVYDLSGFRRLRVGDYEEKIRFVFDSRGDTLPAYEVEAKGDSLVVSWAGDPENISSAGNRNVGEPIWVKDVRFRVKDGKSILTVETPKPGEVIEPVREGDTIRFGIRNATIGRSLRRTIDASSFPSAVSLITPYKVLENGIPGVRFAVELKGPVPYSLQQKGNEILFTVENGPFTEASPPRTEIAEIEAPDMQSRREDLAATIAAKPSPPPAPVSEEPLVIAQVKPLDRYTGEKISLVFDNAEIRNILQLIGEVGDLNIIAGEEVKGNVTLRLIDVPWDQALDLIMETRGLGMLREGNVVQILPKDRIREMRQAELTAITQERQLEPLITRVISISYTDLKNVAAPARDLLTERGKITEDARNKQLIVTDVPSVIEEVDKLVAILDTPERQVLIEARIVEASSTFSRDLGVKWGLSYQNSGGGPWDASSGSIGLGGSFLISPPSAGSVLGGSGLGSGITFGRVGVDSTILDLRISALEAAGEAKVISTPRVSTLNGGEATISQGTKIPYQSSGDDGLPKTEFVDANLELTVRPVINPDNSIILDISATNSSIGSTVSTGSGSAPAIDTKEAKTMVLIQDGETTVIGGIFVETENSSTAGVPLLMKIPILGHLFKSSNFNNTRSELMIFITPRIVQ